MKFKIVYTVIISNIRITDEGRDKYLHDHGIAEGPSSKERASTRVDDDDHRK